MAERRNLITGALVNGPVVQAGAIGQLTIQGQPVVLSRYLEQVEQRIAPLVLRDRDTELAELGGFCTEADGSEYLWLRAEAWAGKSALVSWFVLHPPPGVRVVSFFVTARFAGQSDRVAFVNVVLEQLAELLGQAMPANLNDTTREAHLFGLLTDAAAACQRQGERLVLVVDGLDEDRGVVAGPDSHSIAALLPTRPKSGLRVVVTGRPHPPIPTDVPDDHPLRDPGIRRALATSRHASATRNVAERELDRLLHGSPAEQDLLGVLTASGGGLSGADLAELTGCSVWQIHQRLGTVSGRTFTPRVSGGGPDVYVLGHEELQKTAAESLELDARLDGYRQRLHDWADRYRDRGWPVDTPEYLLRGYYHMLRAVRDTERQIRCATDPQRHDRMLDRTGGDIAALDEIVLAQEAIFAQDVPDLLASARVAIRRDRLVARNANMPADLPAVWATLGHPTRGEALARSIPDPARRVAALTALARVLVAGGHADRAGSLVDQAAVAAHLVHLPSERIAALGAVVDVIKAIGERTRAQAVVPALEALIGSINGYHKRYHEVEALAVLADAVAAAGDTDRAGALLDRAEELARPTADHYDMIQNNPYSEAWALGVVMRVVAAWDTTRANKLLVRARALARSTVRPYRNDETLTDLLMSVVAAGDLRRAEFLAGSMTDPRSRIEAFGTLLRSVAATGDTAHATLVASEIDAEASIFFEDSSFVDGFDVSALVAWMEALATSGDGDRAEALVSWLSEPDEQAEALTAVAWAMAGAGDIDRAREMAYRAEDVARLAPSQYSQTDELAALAWELAATGDIKRATALVDSATMTNEWNEELSGAVARVLAAAGDTEAAEKVIRSIEDSIGLAQEVTALVPIMAAAGDVERAEQLIQLIDPRWRSRALSALARALSGDTARANAVADRAEAAALTSGEAHSQAAGLIALAMAAIAIGDLPRAEILAAQVKALVPTIDDQDWRARTLTRLALVIAEIGDTAEAESLLTTAEQLLRPISWPEAEATIDSLAAIGRTDRAEALASSLAHMPYAHARALTAVAKHVSPDRARRLVVQAFQVYKWIVPLSALARLQPAALAALADDFLGR